MRGSLPATIEIRQNIASDCMPVIADPTELHQVIVNLCTNAYHAMREKGGLLEVGLHDVNFSAQDVTPSLNLKPGRYVRLRVRDTGCGMDDATRRRMFEPFFTTKTEGEGTGLGLATVHGIVKGLHGAIEVSSAPGEGTCIEVYFPASMEPTEPPPARDAPPPSPEPGTERILVVDDEEAVARSTGMALERLGYRVTTCLDSVEAREAFEGDPHAFDLVITDQTMPEMTGFELASVMLGLRPELPVILRTGFDEMMSAQGVREVGIREMLKKPVSHQLLAATVRRLLDDTRA
jgi:CheY-like chemotaxis protein